MTRAERKRKEKKSENSTQSNMEKDNKKSKPTSKKQPIRSKKKLTNNTNLKMSDSEIPIRDETKQPDKNVELKNNENQQPSSNSDKMTSELPHPKNVDESVKATKKPKGATKINSKTINKTIIEPKQLKKHTESSPKVVNMKVKATKMTNKKTSDPIVKANVKNTKNITSEPQLPRKPVEPNKKNTNKKLNNTLTVVESKCENTGQTSKSNKVNNLRSENQTQNDQVDQNTHQTQDALVDTNLLPNQSDKLLSTKSTEQVIDRDTSIDIIAQSLSDTQQGLEPQAWIQMRNGFIDTIVQKETEIMDLKNQIKSLEHLLQTLTNAPSIPEFYTETGVSSNMQAYTKDKDTITSCYIIGDSQVRGICEKVSQLLPNTCRVEAFFQPGAGFQQVARTHTTSPGLIHSDLDSVVIMCGTNDVCITTWDEIKSALDKLASRFHDCKQTIVIGIPLRFDMKKLNFHIHRLNTKIRNYVQNNFKNNSIVFVNPSQFLKFKDYSVDGLHLNRQGKEKLSNKIKNNIAKHYSLHRNEPSSRMDPKPITEEQDLIDLTQPELIELSVVVDNEESTFSPLFPDYDRMFPDINTPVSIVNNPSDNSTSIQNQSILGTPNLPEHINDIINNRQNHSSDYYQITNISQWSVSNNESYYSPIPTITPSQNRLRTRNQIKGFIDVGLTSIP
uniref:Uncharacterized protein n=1 Tax=Cacopsylla melanoneura TaxID=428564 RepID=A0A8D8ZAF1_9HEMI